MWIELIPDPAPDDGLAQAAASALARQRLADLETRPGTLSPWRRAALEETAGGNVSPGRRDSEAASPGRHGGGYVPPAPSSRGATRA